MSSHPTPSPSPVVPEPTTAVGVDLGVKKLLVAAPESADPDVGNALVVESGVERALYDGLGDTLDRLDGLPADTTEAEAQAICFYQEMIYQRFALTTATLLEYLCRVGADIVALEDLDQEPRSLTECCQGRTKAGSWLLPVFLELLEATLAEAGYRVQRVNPKYTTQQCHVCGELASVSSATISCETADCPVDQVCRDRSAAVSIARRAEISETTNVRN